jgi:preprotein translocase subunit SecA
VEYKRESFDMFGQMQERIENDIVRFLFLLEPMSAEDRQREEQKRRQEQAQIFAAASRSASGVTARGGVKTVERKDVKTGRNDPCHCGSGKKFKKCHGKSGAPVASG